MWLTKKVQDKINYNNRKKLTNQNPTLICSNCFGGILYHWLGLRFNSPFINLYMNNDDFILALENWDYFISQPILEDKNNKKQYPVGVIYLEHDTKVELHFMHYTSFKEAVYKWNSRLSRIDMNNIGVILSNWNGNKNILEKFEKIPFKYKVAFTDENLPEFPHSYYLKGYKISNKKNIWTTKNIIGIRYVDQFDYVSFINQLKK